MKRSMALGVVKVLGIEGLYCGSVRGIYGVRVEFRGILGFIIK